MMNQHLSEDEIRYEIGNVPEVNCHTFVEAGAGAGKTTLIVKRICNLLRTGVYNAQEIVVITFTNKAATELYERISSELDRLSADCAGVEKENIEAARENIDRMNISTIHSFCYRILREQVFDVGRGMSASLIEEDEAKEQKCKFFKEWIAKCSKNEQNRENLHRLEQLQGKYYFENYLLPAFCGVADYFDREIIISDSIENMCIGKDSAYFENRSRDIIDECVQDIDATARKCFGRALKNLAEGDIGAAFKPLYNAYKEDYAKIVSFDDFFQKNIGSKVLGKAVFRAPKTMLKDYLKTLGVNKTEREKLDTTARKELDKLSQEFDEGTGVMAEKILNLSREREQYIYYYVLRIVEQAKKDYAAARKFTEMKASVDGIKTDLSLISNDELLHLTKKLVQSEIVVDYFAKRYKAYYVDEFQDTDHVQRDIIWKLTGLDKGTESEPKVTAFMVGDPKQSIYRFRGAEISVFEDAKEQIARHKYGRLYILKRNYRSNEALINNINNAFSKKINNYTEMEASEAGKADRGECLQGVYEYEYPKSKDKSVKDAYYTAQLVEELLDCHQIYDRKIKEKRQVQKKDILILMMHQSGIMEYKKELDARGIAANVSGNMDISENDVLGRFCGILGYLANPREEAAAATAIQCYFHRKLATLSKEEYRQKKKELREELQAYFEKSAEAAFRGLAERLDVLLSPKNSTDPIAVLDAKTKLTQMIETVLCEVSGTLKDYHEAACRYCSKKLERELILNEDEDAVRIMNLHKAKGLEAPIVIYANRDRNEAEFGNSTMLTEQGVYYSVEKGPAIYGNHKVISGYELDEDIKKEAKEQEEAENVRLEYVGVTRSEEVFILMPQKSGTNPLFSTERLSDLDRATFITQELEEERKQEEQRKQEEEQRKREIEEIMAGMDIEEDI